MPKLFLGLCSFVLIVGLSALPGGGVGASDTPTPTPGTGRRAADRPSFAHPRPSWQVIRVAKKKPSARAKKTAKKAEPDEPAESSATPAPAADAKDDGGLKFARDVAPIFVANCVNCHSGKGQGVTKSKLDLSTFDRLMKGSATQKVIEPGDPEASELVLRVKGESQGPKMPPGAQRNLGGGAIAKIEQWIKAGARIDPGLDPKAPLASYASTPEQLNRARLAKMKPEERDDLVKRVGLERWKKASPKVTPDVTVGKSAILFSALPKGRAEAALKQLDALIPRLKALAGPDATDWVEKPSLFVFNDRVSFVEFARDVKGGEPEEEERATSDFSKDEPFVAVVDPLGGQEDPAATSRKSARKKADDDGAVASRTLPGILAEQLTIGVLSTAGKPPSWLVYGMGAFMEAQLERGSPYIMGLRGEAYRLCEQGWAAKAQEAMGDQTKSEEVRAVGYALIDAMAQGNAPVARVVHGLLQGGDKLDDVLGNVLGMNREQFLQVTGNFVMQSYGGRRR